jgi:hypothetical protein
MGGSTAGLRPMGLERMIYGWTDGRTFQTCMHTTSQNYNVMVATWITTSQIGRSNAMRSWEPGLAPRRQTDQTPRDLGASLCDSLADSEIEWGACQIDVVLGLHNGSAPHQVPFDRRSCAGFKERRSAGGNLANQCDRHTDRRTDRALEKYAYRPTDRAKGCLPS